MTKADKLKAQLVIVTGLLVLSIFIRNENISRYLIYTATGFGLIVSIFPFIGDIFVKYWFKLAEGLGWINSRIILSIVFYLILLPISILYRLFTKNPLLLKREDRESYFEERNHKYVKEDMENIW